MIGYKKVVEITSRGNYYRILKIQTIGKIVSPCYGFGKRRCESVRVISAHGMPDEYGYGTTEVNNFSSRGVGKLGPALKKTAKYVPLYVIRRDGTTYQVGKKTKSLLELDEFVNEECGSGIHFFSRAFDAIEYCK